MDVHTYDAAKGERKGLRGAEVGDQGISLCKVSHLENWCHKSMDKHNTTVMQSMAYRKHGPMKTSPKTNREREECRVTGTCKLLNIDEELAW